MEETMLPLCQIYDCSNKENDLKIEQKCSSEVFSLPCPLQRVWLSLQSCWKCLSVQDLFKLSSQHVLGCVIFACICMFADNTKAVLMFANEAHQLVSDALTELVEVTVIELYHKYRCFFLTWRYTGLAGIENVSFILSKNGWGHVGVIFSGWAANLPSVLPMLVVWRERHPPCFQRLVMENWYWQRRDQCLLHQDSSGW